MQSLRDVERTMKKEIEKGRATPLELKEIGFNPKDGFKEITSMEQYRQVLNWLLRLNEYRTGEATVVNNVYMDMKPMSKQAEFSRARHLEKNIHTRSIVDLSAMELCQGITSSDVFEMQKEEITRITPDTTSFYDVLLMLYYGMWCFHLGDWWEGYNYRKNALIMASNFDVGEYEREFATLRTLHFSYSGYVGNTISSYEANLAEMEKDKEAPINGYYQITIMFAYLFLGEASKAQVFAENQYRIALEQKDRESAMIILGTLGRAYINNGNLEKGKEAIYKSYNDACNMNHCWGQIYALIGLTQYYRAINDPHGCCDMFNQTAQTCKKYNCKFIMGSPFMIDIFKYIEDNNLHVDGYSYEDVIENHLRGPHLHAKGAAFRHKAKLLIDSGASSNDIIRAFKSSMELLNKVESYGELSKTQIQYALYLLSIGNKDGAATNARNALRLSSHGIKVDLPFELSNLLGKEADDDETPLDMTNLKLEVMHILNKDIMISRLITSLERILKAEKAAFIVCNKDRRTVIFSDNSPFIKEDDELYNEMMIKVAYCEEKKDIVCISPRKKYVANEANTTISSPSLVIAIPLEKNKEVKGVVYLESFSRDSLLSDKEEFMLDDFRKEVAENVLNILNVQGERYADIESQEEEDLHGQFYISKDKQIREIYTKLDKVSNTSVPVLITGETGVGKEVFAKDIFSKSKYQASFVKVNCGAIPENLIESELFGYEKGSFTGATGRKIGYFEAANGGTIFLDEIGELPLSAQVKLLRVLQDKEITRVGGTQSIPIDFRLIAATNRDLAEEVKKGNFREDLFYRLNIIQIEVPPLRQRKTDITQMAKFFVSTFEEEIGKKGMYFSDDTLLWMLDYQWPGNIRELENTIHRAVILSDGDEIQITKTEKKKTERIHVETLEEVERNHIINVLNTCEGRVSGPNGAAVLLGMKRTTLQARMEKLGIKRDTEKSQ